MKQRFAAEIKPGDPPFSSYFVLAKKETKQAKSGDPYQALILCDRTGEIEARWWDMNACPAEAGQVVGLKAAVEEYPKGVAQLNILEDKFRLATPEEYSIADMLPAAARDPNEMLAELFSLTALHVKNEDLKNLICGFLYDTDVSPAFMSHPASKLFHHAYVGGLLEHALGLVHAAIAIKQAYPDLNLDVLIAGAVFHDAGKMKELSGGLGFPYTLDGKLIGHVLIGYHIFLARAMRFPIPRDLECQILHLIASHHGSREQGAAVEPATKEAAVFHFLDMIDSRMGAIRAAEARPGDEPNFTAYIPMLKTAFYKGEPCPTNQDFPVSSEPASMMGPQTQSFSTESPAPPGAAPNSQDGLFGPPPPQLPD